MKEDKAKQIADTNEILEKLQEVFNLPENLISLEIKIDVDKVPKINYETFISNDIVKEK